MPLKRAGTASVLIVDDHPLVCHYLSTLVAANPHLPFFGEANSLNRANELLTTGSPSLAIIDISLGGGNGLELIKRLKLRNPSTKILVFSAHEEQLYASRSLSVGAHGYINKQEDLASLEEAIHRVLDGKVWLSPSMSERLLQDVFHDNPTLMIPTVSMLSNRELQVFECIGRGIKTSDIAKQLNLSIKTIETHREKAKKKLKLDTGHELTHYAMQWIIEQGYASKNAP